LTLEQIIDESRASSKLDVYDILNKFVGWSTQLSRRAGNPLMTNTILNFLKGAKACVRNIPSPPKSSDAPRHL
jgi:hypothetical protein